LGNTNKLTVQFQSCVDVVLAACKTAVGLSACKNRAENPTQKYPYTPHVNYTLNS